MPDLILKPAAQSGNKIIIQDQAGGAVLTTADSGATIASNVTGIPAAGVTGVLPAAVTGGSGLTALVTVTSGNLSNSAIVYPAGHIIQVKGTDNYHTQNFDTDEDVVIEVSLTNVLASSYVAIWTSCTIHFAGSSAEGFETYVYRKATTMGSAGTAVSGATKVSAVGGNAHSATFSYIEVIGSSYTHYAQTPYFCIDESPATGTNYYALVGSGYATQTPDLTHDGNSTILVMEIAQ